MREIKLPDKLVSNPPKDMKIAANLSAKSECIIRPGPYGVFTTVNRKATLNTNHAIIAEQHEGRYTRYEVVREVSRYVAPAADGAAATIAVG
jgi:hypothetical protein